jgi:hypothetical protein
MVHGPNQEFPLLQQLRVVDTHTELELNGGQAFDGGA